VLASTVLLGACGTISNEDLQFAAILPDQNLAMALPATANMNASTLPPRGAASFDAAINTATVLNGLSRGVAQRLRLLVVHPASVRTAGHREWPAIAVNGYPGYLRLIMDVDSSVKCEQSASQVDASASGYAWRVEAAKTAAGPFSTLIAGKARGTEFAESCGTIDFDVAVNRNVGGSETALDPNAVHFSWYRVPSGTVMTAKITAAPSPESALVEGKEYRFTSTKAGGSFDFERRYLPANRPGVFHLINATLAWGPAGTPWRSDFHIEDVNGTELSHGLSCGDDFGAPTFDRDDVPPHEDVDDDRDDNCTYDYSGAASDPDDAPPPPR
jgi:hypothetical protein